MLKKYFWYTTSFILGYIVSWLPTNLIFFAIRTGCDSVFNDIQESVAAYTTFAGALIAVALMYIFQKKYNNYKVSLVAALITTIFVVSIFGYLHARYSDYSDEKIVNPGDCSISIKPSLM